MDILPPLRQNRDSARLTAAGCALGFAIAAAAQWALLPQWAGKLRAQPWVWALCFALSYECATVFADA
jgi:hypothetical protein